MTINLSKLAHIKTIVPNVQETYDILVRIFGVKKLRDDFVNENVKVMYIGIGDTVIQYIEPIDKHSLWYKQLQVKGPGIFSLAFIVENAKEAVQFLENEENVSPILSREGDKGEKINNFPLEFLNPEIKTEYIINTIEQVGFNIEFGEKPSDADFTFPQTQYVSGSDKLIGDASTMLHIELVTPNAEESHALLKRAFGSNIVEKQFSALLDSPFMHIIHVNLSDAVLQYCQPIGKQRSWYELLMKSGALVHNLTYGVKEIEETVNKFKKEGFSYLFRQKLTPNDADYFYMFDSLNKIGFHLENFKVPVESMIPKGFFFKDLKKD